MVTEVSSGAVAPSLDKFCFGALVDEGEAYGALCSRVSTETGERSEWVNALSSRQPTGGVIQVRRDGGRLSVSGNPSRLRHWHSVDGVPNGTEALSVMNEVLQAMPGRLPLVVDVPVVRFQEGRRRFEAESAVKLTRVDVCCTYACGSEANAREFLRVMQRQAFNGTWPRPFKNGLTVLWKNDCRSVQYYAKWADPYLADKKLPHFVERQRLTEFLRASGAVRHEVTLRSEWLRSKGLRSPSQWTEAQVASVLGEFSPHVGRAVVRHSFDDVAADLRARGASPRMSKRLVRVLHEWATGGDLLNTFSRTTLWRVRKDLLPFGFDISLPPEADAGAGSRLSDCGLRPLVLPAEFRFLAEPAGLVSVVDERGASHAAD